MMQGTPPGQQMQQMQVTVPAGIGPGMSFMVNTPSGMIQVTCPQGVTAGGQMLVHVPAAQLATVQAVPAGAEQGGVVMGMVLPDEPVVAPVPMQMATPPEQQTMERTVPIGSIPPGGTHPLWSAQELTGTFICCCLPGGCSQPHSHL